MTGREKVIEDFKKLRKYADSDVHPVVSPDNWNVYSELRDLIDKTEKGALALLKAQEPRNAIVVSNGIGMSGGWWFQCPSCKMEIEPRDRYCKSCGQAVKWE